MEFIKEYPIEKLKVWEKNPRKNDKAADKLTNMIEEYGFINPIIIDQHGTIRAGHTRLKAAQKLNKDTVPVLIYDFQNEAQAIGYAIADNKLSEIAEWDFEQLDELMNELEEMDFDTSLTGFEESEMESFRERPEVEEDEVPEVPEEPITKRSDIWLLGKHRVMCGDSTDEADVLLLMDGKKADMVFTDPPYGMHLDADWSAAKSRLDFAKEKNVLGGKKHNNVIGDHADFSPDLIYAALSIPAKERFIWGADYFAEYLPDKNNGSWIVWDKRIDESADKMYGSCFELCWSEQRHKREIARVKWAGIFGTEQEFDHKRHHPTQKPSALVEWFFERWGGNIVVDIYLGSGSTLIASEQTNCTCYGMEIDEHYCDVIVQRYINFKGADDDVFLIRNDEKIKYSNLRGDEVR